MKKNFNYIVLLLLFCTSCNGNLSAKKRIDAIAENIVIDSILVKKDDRKLIVFSNKQEIKTYDIALGKSPIGKKHFEGDMKTPEGLYVIDAKSAVSKYHKNLNISYPNKEDILFANSQNKKCGGDIKIHGLPNGRNDDNYTRSDWTWGCIALTNAEIDELFKHVKLGCKILILP